MIARILVPADVQPPAGEGSGPARPFTYLDRRMVVPADLPVRPLDMEHAIPAHVPLEVLGERMVVPRDARLPAAAAGEAPPTVLDRRLVVPKGARLEAVPPAPPLPPEQLPEVVDRDVLTTGQVNLLPREVEAPAFHWQWQAKVSSAVFHALLIVLILLQPKIPARPVSEEEVERAHRLLGMIYLPPEVRDVPRLPPPDERPSDVIRIDPRALRRIAPPEAEPSPLPGAPIPPAVQGRADGARQAEPPGSSGDREAGPLRPEPPPAEPEPRRALARAQPPPGPPSPGLALPKAASPGRMLEDSIRGAARTRGGQGVQFGDPAPPAPGIGGGGGQGYMGGAVQMLTPDEGVDFSNYLARVLASVRRNWYAVIPESARMGEQGRVVLQFRIMRDGGVPSAEPHLLATSGREPLDRAAMSSIRASHPFEPLPAAFSGPYIELRFIFLYNLPLDYQ